MSRDVNRRDFLKTYLVQIRPVNSYPLADQTPVFSLFRRGFLKPGEPSQRHADFSSVSEADINLILIEPNVCSQALSFFNN